MPSGLITVEVDLRDVSRKVFHVEERLPAEAGDLTLMLPKWIQGTHAPWPSLASLAGLRITAADGHVVPWRRDATEPFAFHVDVPSGAPSLTLRFDYLTPASPDAFWTGLFASATMLDLPWNAVVLYPRGQDQRQVTLQPAVQLPEGWAFACALDGAKTDGSLVRFAPVSLETLLDSPLFAGRYRRVLDIAPDQAAPVRIAWFAESPAYLEAGDNVAADWRRLHRETMALFGASHYDHYDFLVSLSDTFGGKGLEHHRSTEIGLALEALTDYAHQWHDREVLAHEYVHSWNGKYRRPFDSWGASPEVPLRNSLLWVYEGLTQYWGKVLSARAGLFSTEQARDDWAQEAAHLGHLAGRHWRPLRDTVYDEMISDRNRLDWPSWQRQVDYYGEGAQLWLEADAWIRERSGGKRSLDDFARRFFGADDGQRGPDLYDFDQLCAALSAVEPRDWAGFLRGRLEGVDTSAAQDGLRRAGWQLVFDDKPNDAISAADAAQHVTSFEYSLGLTLGREDAISDVIWDGPAFRAGMAPGGRLIAVNGLKFSVERLKAGITAASRDPAAALVLDVMRDDRLQQFRVDWHGGNRYPHLEPVDGSVDRLTAILAARATPAGSDTAGH